MWLCVLWVSWGMQVALRSFVPPQELPGLYECVDVLVSPYIGMETYAITNIEAMAMALPFLHYGIGGIQVRSKPAAFFAFFAFWRPVGVASPNGARQ